MYAGAELGKITEQFINKYAPNKLLLFGSQAKNTAKNDSDIDVCVVINTDNRRKLLADMYFNIHSDKPIDIVLYTPEQWERNVADTTSFAYQINREGVLLYG